MIKKAKGSRSGPNLTACEEGSMGEDEKTIATVDGCESSVDVGMLLFL